MDMATIHECRTHIRFLSRSEVVQERKELFRIINGDALFPTKSQPDDTEMLQKVFERNLQETKELLN